MSTKILEVRDRGTLIPVMAIRLEPETDYTRKLLWRVGFERPERYVLLIHLAQLEVQHDHYAWCSDRTMGEAHRWIIDHFDELAPGDVVDVEYILCETSTRKGPEL